MTSFLRKVKKVVSVSGEEKDGSKTNTDIPSDDLEELDFKQNVKQDVKRYSSGDDDTTDVRMKIKESVVMMPGDYTIQVHIIEARDLKSEDANGRSDPMVTVEIMGKNKSTNIKRATTNVKWDEVLYFEFKNLSPADLPNGKCSLLVYDADLLTRNDLIGSFDIDLCWIYFKENHEIFKQWIALNHIHEDLNSAEQEEECKVPGYLKVSIVILGPNDEQKIHTEEEMEDEDEGLILIAPEIKQFPHMLKIKIYEARELPRIDNDLISLSKVGCDPFVWVEFAGQRLRSKVFKGLNPVFQSEFCLPVMEPVFTKLITISLMDYDKLSRNDRIGVLKFDYQELKAKDNWHMPPQWYTVYGGPLKSNRGVTHSMNKGLLEGVMYRGQLLIEITLEKLEKRGKLQLNTIDNLSKSLRPKWAEYELMLHLYEGSEITQVGVNLLDLKIHIEFSIGLLSGISSEKDLHDGEEGQVLFYEKICNDNGRRNTTLGPVKLYLGEAIETCPDLFIYLCMPAAMLSKVMHHLAYIRIPFRKIICDGWGNEPQWYDLKENRALDKYSDHMFPGSLLIGIGAGLSSELDKRESKNNRSFTFRDLAYKVQPPKPKNYNRMISTIEEEEEDNSKEYNAESVQIEITRVDEFDEEEHNAKEFAMAKFQRQDSFSKMGNFNVADISVRVIQASNLPAMDRRTKKSDPFVVLEIDDKNGIKREFRTMVIRNTLQPEWKMKFKLADIAIGQKLKVNIFDFDVGRMPEKIGHLFVPLVGENTSGEWFDITPSSLVLKQYKRKVPKSRIRLSFEYDFNVNQDIPIKRHGGILGLMKNVTKSAKTTFSLGNISGSKKMSSKAASFADNTLDKPKTYPMQLRCHIFQAKNLISGDRDGLSDPYLVVRFCGKRAQTHVISDSLDPKWYCTIFHENVVRVPFPMKYSPRIYCELIDKDVFSDDIIGKFTVFPEHVWTSFGDREHSAQLPDPEWYNLVDGNGCTIDGELLASFQLVSIQQMPYPLPSLDPPTSKKWMHIITLGLRNMGSLMGIYKPYVKFEVNGLMHKTKKSNNPSAHNPNYLQLLSFAVDLPIDTTFLPNLNLMVRDSLFGGLIKRTLGHASIELEDLMCDQMQFKYTAAELETKTIRDNKKQVMEEEEEKKRANVSYDEEEMNHGFGGGFESDRYTNEDTALLTSRSDHHSVDKKDVEDDGSISKGKRDYLPFEFNDRAKHDLSKVEPPYMDNRDTYDDELEDVMPLRPFLQIPIFTGKNKRTIGYFKGLIKFTDNISDPIDFDRNALRTPVNLILRVYILRGRNLVPRDTNGTSDPYLIVKCGKKTLSFRDKKLSNISPQNICEFYEAIEMPCTIPGTAKVEIEVWDWDGIGDDIIGKTEIDIEDRWFTDAWKQIPKKPVEYRTLWVPTSSASQGKLALWIDIMTVNASKKYPLIDINPPPPNPFEMRVIVWKCKECPVMDTTTNMNDLYITCNLDCGQDSNLFEKQKTDLHFRSQNGKGSFNWRIKWPLMLPMKVYPRLMISVWDKDFFSANDSISELNISLQSFFKYCAKYGTKDQVRFTLEGKEKFWLKSQKKDNGSIQVSFEIMPKKIADRLPAGFGRDEPNSNPYLPEPEGRAKFSLLHPWDSIRNLLGDRLILKIYCIMYCVILVAFLVYTGPSLFASIIANEISG